MILSIKGSEEMIIICFGIVCGCYNTLEYRRQVLKKVFNQAVVSLQRSLLFFILEEKFSNHKFDLLEKYMVVSWIIKSLVE